MAVLVEGISVVVRMTAIHQAYTGGWEMFRVNSPNKTLCCDNELVRAGFMSPENCRSFTETLGQRGLVFFDGAECKDFVVADQMTGFTGSCTWAEFGRIEIRPGQR